MIDQTMTDIFNQSNTNNDQLVTIDQMVNNQEQIVNETTPKKKKMDKVLMIQLILLAAWAILTAVVYFFGYDFLSPFIKV